MIDSPERDPLDDLLARPGPVDAAALRQAILAQTSRRLRRVRRLRRLALAGALAACYAAGLLTMHLLAPAAASDPVAPVVENQKQETPPEAPTVAVAPAAVERQAETAPDPERASLLRQAGDRYLTEESDPEAALRCYGKALDAGSADDTKFSPDDNWLLMAIKNAREKEARHANDDG
jgi:hypothetical protein